MLESKNKDKLRGIVVDWLIEVAEIFCLSEDTIFLATGLLDRVCYKIIITKEKYQLFAIGCLLIASKMVDCCRIVCNEFVAISDNAYSAKEVKDVEMEILHALDFNLVVISPLIFLRNLFANHNIKSLSEHDRRDDNYFLACV